MNDTAQDCRACANVPLLTDPDDERFLYCVLPEGHDGEHYDNGAEVFWLHQNERRPRS